MLADFKKGILKAIPVSIPLAIYGTILGVIALQKNLTLFELLLMDTIVFAGAGQFLMLELWSETLPILEIVIAVFIINLRYLLIGASLKDVFSGYTLKIKATMMHLVADENWAVSIAEKNRRKIDPTFVFGGGLVMVFMWSMGTVIGYITGNAFNTIEKQVLNFVIYCVFLSLGVSLYTKKRDIIYWGVAALTAYLVHLLIPGKWYIVAGGLSGSFAAIFSKQEDKK